MCLAVPAQVVERDRRTGIVDLQGNRLSVSLELTPEAHAGDWVLVHAGFAISTIAERDAMETWDYLRAAYDGEIGSESGGEAIDSPDAGNRGPGARGGT